MLRGRRSSVGGKNAPAREAPSGQTQERDSRSPAWLLSAAGGTLSSPEPRLWNVANALASRRLSGASMRSCDARALRCTAFRGTARPKPVNILSEYSSSPANAQG